MSSAAVTYNFTNGLIADADQVDANFNDLVNFLNSHVAHIPETVQLKTGSTSPKVQTGQSTVHVISGNPSGTTTLTFPTAFANTTYQVLLTNTDGGIYVYRVGAKTTTNVPITVTKGDGANFAATADLNYDWLAMGF